MDDQAVHSRLRLLDSGVTTMSEAPSYFQQEAGTVKLLSLMGHVYVTKYPSHAAGHVPMPLSSRVRRVLLGVSASIGWTFAHWTRESLR